jgi:DNA mismatch repair protein PMS2
MHDRPTGDMVRCSKARSMFASRACRKSIMIGKSLTNGQMTKVSKRLVIHMRRAYR